MFFSPSIGLFPSEIWIFFIHPLPSCRGFCFSIFLSDYSYFDMNLNQRVRENHLEQKRFAIQRGGGKQFATQREGFMKVCSLRICTLRVIIGCATTSSHIITQQEATHLRSMRVKLLTLWSRTSNYWNSKQKLKKNIKKGLDFSRDSKPDEHVGRSHMGALSEVITVVISNQGKK